MGGALGSCLTRSWYTSPLAASACLPAKGGYWWLAIMSLFSANNLAKSFGPNDIFRDVSFSIPQRARIGLVGPNGVGQDHPAAHSDWAWKSHPRAMCSARKDCGWGICRRMPRWNPTAPSGRNACRLFDDLIAMQERLVAAGTCHERGTRREPAWKPPWRPMAGCSTSLSGWAATPTKRASARP